MLASTGSRDNEKSPRFWLTESPFWRHRAAPRSVSHRTNSKMPCWSFLIVYTLQKKLTHCSLQTYIHTIFIYNTHKRTPFMYIQHAYLHCFHMHANPPHCVSVLCLAVISSGINGGLALRQIVGMRLVDQGFCRSGNTPLAGILMVGQYTVTT